MPSNSHSKLSSTTTSLAQQSGFLHDRTIARADSPCRDNDLIYLDPVPSASSLSPIVPAAMVRLTPPPEVISPLSYLHNSPGGLGRPLFEALIPYEVHLAAKVYEDRKERLLLEDLVERKNELDSQASL